MIKEAILSLSKKQDLTSEIMEQVMDEIMNNEATDAQKASFLTALAMKGETIDEITAAAKVMRGEATMEDITYRHPAGTRYYNSHLPRPSAVAKVCGTLD